MKIPYQLPESCAYFERGIDNKKNLFFHNYYQIPEFAMKQFVLPGVYDFDLPDVYDTKYNNHVIYNNRLLKYNRKWQFATFLFYPGYNKSSWQIVMLTPRRFRYDFLNEIMRELGKVEPFRVL